MLLLKVLDFKLTLYMQCNGLKPDPNFGQAITQCQLVCNFSTSILAVVDSPRIAQDCRMAFYHLAGATQLYHFATSNAILSFQALRHYTEPLTGAT